MNTPRTLEERITELEVLFMHLQRTVQDLDQVVVDQTRRLDLLAREMKMVAGDLRTLRESAGEARRPEDEIPPHY